MKIVLFYTSGCMFSSPPPNDFIRFRIRMVSSVTKSFLTFILDKERNLPQQNIILIQYKTDQVILLLRLIIRYCRKCIEICLYW